MRIQKVTFSSKAIRMMYQESFPPNERMSFPLMVAMSKLWNTDFLSFYDGDIPCGLIYLAHNGKLVFIMFLAVQETLRSKGYGSAILKEVGKNYPDKKIIVSIESCDALSPDLALREKRKAFYRKNGFKDTGHRMKLSGAEQEILIYNGEFDKSEFRLFFVLYSNGTVWPKIWRNEMEKNI